MVYILWGRRGIWTFFGLILSHRLITAQIDQYYMVSRGAFFNRVIFNCERHVTHSDMVIACAPFCYVPTRPRCYAFALGLGSCWVCGEGIPTHGDMTTATAFWVDSDKCRPNPCSNGGTCISRPHGFQCICVEGWTGTNCDECLEPFTTIGMSCYIIKRHGLASWGDAQNWCDGMGAYLIKIDNEDEDQAIDKRLSVIENKCSDYWIGLSDLDGDRTYTWTDGTDAKYTDWSDTGHYTGSGANCVKLQYAEWRKLQTCGHAKCFICERI